MNDRTAAHFALLGEGTPGVARAIAPQPHTVTEAIDRLTQAAEQAETLAERLAGAANVGSAGISAGSVADTLCRIAERLEGAIARASRVL